MAENTVISSIVDLLKQTPRIFAGLIVPGLFIIFAPEWLIERFGVTDFRKAYIGYIGIVTLLLSGLLLAHFGAFAFSWLSTYIGWRRTINHLTPAEKEALKPFIISDEPTQHFDISDGVANGLVAKRILYRASNVGSFHRTFPYNMQPWAYKHLKRRRGYFE